MNEARTLSAEETARRGEEIYEREIRGRVEAEHADEFLVIDVHTGSYELSPDEAEAFNRAVEKYPEGFFYIKRIGHRAAHRIGRG